MFDATIKTGLSSTSRLNDLFVNIEGMTPTEYKNGGRNLQINYTFHESSFGRLIVASTYKGVFYMASENNSEIALKNLRNNFPNACFHEKIEKTKRIVA